MCVALVCVVVFGGCCYVRFFDVVISCVCVCVRLCLSGGVCGARVALRCVALFVVWFDCCGLLCLCFVSFCSVVFLLWCLVLFGFVALGYVLAVCIVLGVWFGVVVCCFVWCCVWGGCVVMCVVVLLCGFIFVAFMWRFTYV